ncbi:helicase-related protein [Rickettsiales bacterium]|nr:helicase-related protein [Rickettsiales bacterium]
MISSNVFARFEGAIDRVKHDYKSIVDEFEKQNERNIKVSDVLFKFPNDYLITMRNISFNNVDLPCKVYMKVRVVGYKAGASFGRRMYGGGGKLTTVYAVSEEESLPISFLFFKVFKGHQKIFEVGKTMFVSGRLEQGQDGLQVSHPQIVEPLKHNLIAEFKWNYYLKNVITDEQKLDIFKLDKDAEVDIQPIYLGSASVKKHQKSLLSECLVELENELSILDPSDLVDNLRYPATVLEILKIIHFPKILEDLEKCNHYKKILAILNVISVKLSMKFAQDVSKNSKEPIASKCTLENEVMSRLQFELTKDQEFVINEIKEKQAQSKRMFHLVQGDVGSGKTIVALLAILNAVEAGKMAVLLAPTTILAVQHYNLISDLLFGLNIEVCLLTGKMTAKERAAVDLKIKNGVANIIIGTHALLYNKNIKNCGICVIDEQHRFGVNQRFELMKDNPEADFIMMTATPIPRTMLSVMYDGASLSQIKCLPKMRKAINTSTISSEKIQDLVNRIKHKIESENEKVYWLCSAVEETESDVVSVKERILFLSKHFPKDQIFLLHGKMKEKEKISTMQNFFSATKGILVCTTVVEVGINIPTANLIIIEQAERFGLSQLHQLRGRVGRSDKQAFCILMYTAGIPESSKEKLNQMRQTTDGFKIAEADFSMRGAGDISGTSQSGYNSLISSHAMLNGDIIERSNAGFDKVINNIDELFPQIVTLLALFGYDPEIAELMRR